jgi:hypothetical protein
MFTGLSLFWREIEVLEVPRAIKLWTLDRSCTIFDDDGHILLL